MAQKREKEETETELKVPETLTLCTPSPITSKPSPVPSPERPSLSKQPDLHRKKPSQSPSPSPSPEIVLKRREVNRCSGCRRKVGLMGFRCRCGEMFCSDHRYSDRHDCSYDYKGVGREAIARENPVVRAAKILKV
uniref:Zinc finger A20 and AN1 domain-containing stress-associated protein 5-like n=1 Tax=Tanacetum cinerariifolium TaxID=118510 RepID=A0A699KQZ4_TANCI|nr:zinc finger A20 and AN1 domain-containing stress-associated protein 5-like [Tanacetum cinerariifolium]